MSGIPDSTGRGEEGDQRQVRKPHQYVTLDDYWMGRNVKYAVECTPAVKANAELLLAKVNNLLDLAAQENVFPKAAPIYGYVASGWRPRAINDATSNAAASSKHLTGQAIDLRDWMDRRLMRWCLRNLKIVKALALWMEHPGWTPTWVHLQSVPPNSGKLVFIPSTAPRPAARIDEESHIEERT